MTPFIEGGTQAPRRLSRAIEGKWTDSVEDTASGTAPLIFPLTLMTEVDDLFPMGFVRMDVDQVGGVLFYFMRVVFECSEYIPCNKQVGGAIDLNLFMMLW